MEAKPQADDLLIDYLYGELDDEARASFEQKLATQPELRRELEQLRGTRELVAGLGELEPPAAATELLLREAAKVSEAGRPSLWARIHEILQATVMHPAMSTAAALVLVLGVGLFVYQRNQSERVSTVPAADEQWAPSVAAQRTPAAETRRSEERRDEGLGAIQQGAPGGVASGKATGRESYGVASGARELRVAKKRRRLARSTRRRGRSRKEAAPRSPKPGLLEGVVARQDRARAPLEDLAGSDALQAEPSEAMRRPASPAPRAVAPSMPAKVARRKSAVRSRSYGARSSRAPESRAASEESEQSDEVRNEADRASAPRAAAMEWIERGRRAARARRCPQALELFERSLAVDASLWSRIETDVRRCASTLAKTPRRYPRLARALRRSARSAPAGAAE